MLKYVSFTRLFLIVRIRPTSNATLNVDNERGIGNPAPNVNPNLLMDLPYML
jgi:hypothetical protein